MDIPAIIKQIKAAVPDCIAAGYLHLDEDRRAFPVEVTSLDVTDKQAFLDLTRKDADGSIKAEGEMYLDKLFDEC